MSYLSDYAGREVDYAIKQVTEKFPEEFDKIKNDITKLSNEKADTKIIPQKNSQLENDLGFVTEKQIEEILENSNYPNYPNYPNNSVDGLSFVSIHDDLVSIVPKNNEIYIIKCDLLPYYNADGEYLETANPVYIIKIGDGTHNLIDLPTTQNITHGNDGEGSIIQFLESELYEVLDKDTEQARTSRPTAIGKGAVAFGRYNRALNRETAAFNYNNKVLGLYGFAANGHNTVEADAGFAGGWHNIAKGKYQAVFGMYNEPVEEARFIIGSGNGESDTQRKNAFVITGGGDAIVENSIQAKSAVIENGIITKDATIKDDLNVNNVNAKNNIKTTVLEVGSSKINEKNAIKLNEILYKAEFSENTIEQVVSTIRAGMIPNTWNIGDELDIEVGGVTRTIVIIGKNVDTFTNGDIAPFTFQFKDLYDDWKAPMYAEGEQNKGWENSTMRKKTLVSLLNTLPTVLKDSIDPVVKYARDKNKNSQRTEDKLFLLAFSEITDDGKGEESPTYCPEIPVPIYREYFADEYKGTRRAKFLDGTPQIHNLRDAYINEDWYWHIKEDGNRSASDAYESHYFSPAFCIATNKSFSGSYNDLTDKPFGEDGGLHEMYSKQNVPFIPSPDDEGVYVPNDYSDVPCVTISNYRDLGVGKRYRVIFDDVEYDFTCTTDIEVFSVPVKLEPDESDYPITVEFQQVDYTVIDAYITTTLPGDSHSIEIFENDYVLTKLDEKFIPDSIARVEDVNKIVSAFDEAIDATIALCDSYIGGEVE